MATRHDETIANKLPESVSFGLNFVLLKLQSPWVTEFGGLAF